MDQVHLRAVLIDLLGNFAELVRQWSGRSLATVNTWPDLAPAGKQQAALRMLARTPPLEDRQADR